MNFRALSLAVLGLVAVLGTHAGIARADVLYSQNFDSFFPIPGSVDGWWNYYGPGNTSGSFGVDSNGAGGTQSLYLTLDASGEVGTDWYFYAGIGRSNIATPSTALPNARPDDLKFSVAISPDQTTDTKPLAITLSQYNPALAAMSGPCSGYRRWQRRDIRR